MRSALLGTTIVMLFATTVLLQMARDRQALTAMPRGQVLYVRSGALLDRVALSYDALLADVYWIRAIQHFGGTRRSTDVGKRYDLLYPLLDIATTLDPRFTIVYRFGAIFLAEAYPNGPGRADQAIALLKKGVRSQPQKWQYLQDIGFVYYWWLHDYVSAATWFRRAADVEGAPWWLRTLAATTLAQGGERAGSRMLWEQMFRTAGDDWLRREAERRLVQLTALDDIDELARRVQDYAFRRGALPESWTALVGTGYLREPPRDPTGSPYVLDPRTGHVTISSQSALFPLPTEPPPLPSR
ncbi:MAG: hypothetical protein HYX76_01685 [Acidobacteria bacterium]|nr:hypothetical protein [Acidobacteriota bacterium]